MLSRRGFLASLLAGAAGLALDPEFALWVPGQKKIFIPAPQRIVTGHDLRMGDIFTIDQVYALNPSTYKDTGFVKSFVVTRDVKAGPIAFDAISPRPDMRGPYQHCSALPFAENRARVWTMENGAWVLA